MIQYKKAGSLIFLGASLFSLSGFGKKLDLVFDDNYVPPGFENLEQKEQENLVDAYFLGNPITTAHIIYDGTELRILNLDAVIDAMPGVIQKDVIKTALSGKIKNNKDKACPKRKRNSVPVKKSCGLISPDIAGVILNESEFRLNLFVHKDYLEKGYQEKGSYNLLPSSSNFSFLHDIALFINDKKNTQSRTGNMNTLVAYKQAYLDIRSTIQKEERNKKRRRFNIHEIQAKFNHNTKRYYGGWGNYKGTEFLSGRSYLGVGMETTLESMTDKSLLYANPIEVFLPAPSNVRIYRDGKLLSDVGYEAGYQTLNTNTLPGGAYEIEIEIEDEGGNITKKKEFFVRESSMPSKDHPQYYFNMGYMEDRFDLDKKIFPTYSNKAFFQTGGQLRTSLSTYISENIIMTRGALFSETSFHYFINKTKMTPKLFLSSKKDLGYGIYGSTVIFDNINLNSSISTNLRKKDPSKTIRKYDPISNFKYRIRNGLSTRLFGGSISYINNIIRDFNGDVQHSNNFRYYYSWNFSRFYIASFQTSLTFENARTSLLFTLGLQFNEKQWSYNFQNQRSYVKRKSKTRDYLSTYRFGAKWKENKNGVNKNIVGNITKKHDQDTVNINALYENNNYRINPGLNYNRSMGKPNHTRTLRLGTGLAISGTDFSLTNTRRAKQGILININTISKTDGEFEVYLNSRPIEVVPGNSSSFIRVSPYKTYKISIASRSDKRFEVDEKFKVVTIYPGNVDHVEFNAYQIYALISKLVDEKGCPLSKAKLEGGKFFNETDNSGDFQIDTRADQKELIFKKESGEKCVASLPNQKIESGFMEIPKLVCRPI